MKHSHSNRNASFKKNDHFLRTDENRDQKDDTYRILFDSIDEGFCVIEVLFDKDKNPVDYRFLETNPAFKQQTGWTNAVGKTMRELEPAHEDYWFEIYGKVALSRDPVRFERPAEAMGRYYDVYAFPFDDPKKHKVAILFHDISERKKNEYNNAWLSALVDSSFDAIISKNMNGEITSWNSSAERFFGYSADEIIGKNITTLIPDDRLDEETQIMSRLKKGERIDQYETIRKRKDGSTVEVSLTISPIKNSQGTIVGAAKIARDISKRKEAEQKLKRINETLEDRVEERTEELTTYHNKLRLLTSSLNESEETQRHSLATELHNHLGQMLAVANIKINFLLSLDLSDKAQNEIAELSELIHDALNYTRKLMSDLKPPPTLNKEDFSEVLNWLAKKMEKYDLNVSIQDDKRPKPIEEDVRLTLQQSVQELLFNVVKHAGTNDVEIFFTREDKRTLKIKVVDKGNGFDIADTPPVPTHEGGFGLFNINERMDFLGGTFKIISHPGNGTEAILTAPIKKNDSDSTPEKKSKTNIQSGKSHVQVKQSYFFQTTRVMLVDDHEMVRKGLRKMVEEQDDITIVAEASNGEEAVKLASELVPDVIVMDVNLPGIDGIEATQKISAELPDIRIIGLSLYDHEKLGQDMKEAGADEYMTKSEGFDTLFTLIRNGKQ